MISKKKKDIVEVPENWNEMSAEEQDAFVDALIERWVPKSGSADE